MHTMMDMNDQPVEDHEQHLYVSLEYVILDPLNLLQFPPSSRSNLPIFEASLR